MVVVVVNDLYVLPSFTVKVSDARAAVVVVVFVAVKRERYKRVL